LPPKALPPGQLPLDLDDNEIEREPVENWVEDEDREEY
jgi:hypothetical protein